MMFGMSLSGAIPRARQLLSVESFFVYLDSNFFSPDFSGLTNIDISNTTFKWTVLALYFGLVLACLSMYYNKQIIGKMPRALIAAECLSPETAKTVSELGFRKNIFVLLSLCRGYTLRRVIRCKGEEEKKAEYDALAAAEPDKKVRHKPFKYKFDFDSERFFIPEELRYTADIKFSKKGNGIVPLILTAVLGVVAVVLIFRFAPQLFSLLDNALENFGGES